MINTDLQLTQKYLTGINEIDSQHNVLVGMLNELHSIILNKGSEDQVNEIIKKFVDYTVYHFNEEEQLMKMNKYPDLENHKKIHQNIVNNVSKVLTDYKGNKFLRFKFFTIAMDVLMNHIEIVDKKFADYMRNK